MSKEKDRRSFLKKIAFGVGGIGVSATPDELLAQGADKGRAHVGETKPSNKRGYNRPYEGEYLNRVAFPIGGIGAGMFCMEGTGAISHVSVRHKPDVFNEPVLFAALAIKGSTAKVVEGPVPEWKMFGKPGTANGASGATYGLPRFNKATFASSFPFGVINLKDDEVPLDIAIKGWSPFTPGDPDNASLPVGALEYVLTNKGKAPIEAVFSYHAVNFLVPEATKGAINQMPKGFVLRQDGTKEMPQQEGNFAIFTDENEVVIDYCWFRGGWFDPLTMTWNIVKEGATRAHEPVPSGAPGASLFIPVKIKAGGQKKIKIMMAWYMPETSLHFGAPVNYAVGECDAASGCCSSPAAVGLSGEASTRAAYKPWYSSKFKNIDEVTTYWKKNYDELYKKSALFNEAFYKSTWPSEVIEAIAANLTILKSPTVMRQEDGRFWSYEGCSDNDGCCHGSCTHVWNYAQAVAHLFPSLERSLRHTEFCENQSAEGHQTFRANLPISPTKHDFHAAADGQLGGIMKVYREWRISGDNDWLVKIYPAVKRSLDFCILAWDPRKRGLIEEPHHNTYDIEFWGADGMCTSFYLGALKAMIEISKFLKKDFAAYQELFEKGRQRLESDLFNGEYFIQKVQVKDLKAESPAEVNSIGGKYSNEAKELLEKEGPKYQYGSGCLSDGILGVWIGAMCGLQEVADTSKVKKHLEAVHKYNLKKDLSDHSNSQRPSFALGKEGGLLLCTWPKGGKPSLPFVYSDEVWTGIEYQVASHLILAGRVGEGLEIVRTCRDRYNGRIRNPFNEYECGHWYARALSSYGLIQALTGLRFDALDKILYIDSKIGDFTSFFSWENGFGNVSLKNGQPRLKVAQGNMDVKKVIVAGKEMTLQTL